MNILVTGGAGYIGSVIAEQLLKRGHRVIVLDNLQQGHKEAVSPRAIFIKGRCGNKSLLNAVFKKYKIESVMHLAAESTTGASMTEPQKYFLNNIVEGLSLLDVMLANNIKKVVFSSTAAVYGEPKEIPIPENHPLNPVNAYGESKLIFERMLNWYGRAHGIKYITFRYFNAAGASENYGEDHRPESHLIPLVLQLALNIKNNPAGKPGSLEIFGADYPTRDGSCIRDYIHVMDLAQAHILALEKIDGLKEKVFNLGNGTGYSVLEVIKTVNEITGINIPKIISSRRLGDPAALVASSDLAKRKLGWKPIYPGLKAIIKSAWDWQKKYPKGYE